ncbi:hypothetical protein PLESTB_001092800 [Pleodorina starrii]|uniref:Uncharacterized protein n=1 Tax=Pleodorina starrii TaxID=330485 RepID=A0A9W6F5E7_9CHLO|nr:hypothetical protein PLESTB_001092800 [Pleodorina starrii]
MFPPNDLNLRTSQDLPGPPPRAERRTDASATAGADAPVRHPPSPPRLLTPPRQPSRTQAAHQIDRTRAAGRGPHVAAHARTHARTHAYRYVLSPSHSMGTPRGGAARKNEEERGKARTRLFQPIGANTDIGPHHACAVLLVRYDAAAAHRHRHQHQHCPRSWKWKETEAPAPAPAGACASDA